jgi:hypothetical protein
MLVCLPGRWFTPPLRNQRAVCTIPKSKAMAHGNATAIPIT